MITLKNLNEIIKTRKFLITAQQVIKEKLNENLVDIIIGYTGFLTIPKEEIKKMFGLITLICNRIYYMYNNDISDWMYYYNHNNYQVIIWNNKNFNINKLNELYIIISELLKSYFDFNVSIIKNFNTHELKLKINEEFFMICLDNYNSNEINSIFEIIKTH
jgi:hypothetical protein